jgi:hypothetical protein
MADAIARPERESYLLVTFQYGDPNGSPTFVKYTDWTQPILGHSSVPTLEVEDIENEGTFQEKELRLAIPVIDSFTTAIASGLKFAPTWVFIDEINAGLFAGDAGSARRVFVGRVMRTIKNFEGDSGVVVFFCQSIKSRLKAPVGIQCNHHCSWRLFGPGCNAAGLTQSTHDQTCEITSIDGKEVTITTPNLAITSPSSPGGRVDRFWERGYMEKDGLKLDIHLWSDADPTKFVLRRRPPNDWLLAGSTSILVVPGCHKTIEDCREVWDNEEAAGHFGYAMLAYNPQFESPA